MIKRNIVCLFMLMLFLIVFCKDDIPETRTGDNVEERLAVTATKDDLCRLVLLQDVFVKPDSYDEKEMIVSLLSDGSSVRELMEEDTLQSNYGSSPSYYHLSSDEEYISYKIAGAVSNYRFENVFIFNLRKKEKDSLFSISKKYSDNGALYVNCCDYNPLRRELLVSTSEFIRLYSLDDGAHYDLPGTTRGVLWLGNDRFVFNRRHNDSIWFSEYNVVTKKMTVVDPTDTFDLGHASATLSGDRVLIDRDYDTDTDGKLGDSIYFFDASMKLAATCFIRNDDRAHFQMGPFGRWIYYVDRKALRRVRINKITETAKINLEVLNDKAQVIFTGYYATVDGFSKKTSLGTLTQILPLGTDIK